MAEYDIVIRGGTIVDGLRTPRYVSDLAVRDGRVVKIGGLRSATARRTIDATGLVVAPGFIDTHTHYDAQIFWDPYCSVSSWHGVTTIAIGNCGFGFAPCAADKRDRAMRALTRNEAIPYEAMKLGMRWDELGWKTFPDYLNALAKIPKGLNVVSYVPLTPVYTWVMGWDGAKQRRPTETELSQMYTIVNDGLDAGAIGWSAQVFGPQSIQRDYDGTPMVTDLMTDDEIFGFARVLAQRDEGFIELSYFGTGEEKRLINDKITSVYERVAAESRRPVLYQAVVANIDNPEQHRQRLKWLEACNRRGLRIFGQSQLRRSEFHLTFNDWNLFDQSPAWRIATLGTPAERKAKMQDPEVRAAMRSEWDRGILPEGAIRGSVAGLIIDHVGHKDLRKYEGMSVSAIARKEGKHVIDALLDIVVADNLNTEIIAPQGRDYPEGAAEIANSPFIVAGLSDGGAHVKFTPGGSYPTDILQWLVRDKELVSLEEAHCKLSYLPAQAVGIRDRGFIREGAPADIVIYDLNALDIGTEEVVDDLPGGDWRRVQRPSGYRWTIVNGRVTFEDGRPSGDMPGALLRHGSGT